MVGEPTFVVGDALETRLRPSREEGTGLNVDNMPDHSGSEKKSECRGSQIQKSKRTSHHSQIRGWSRAMSVLEKGLSRGNSRRQDE